MENISGNKCIHLICEHISHYIRSSKPAGKAQHQKIGGDMQIRTEVDKIHSGTSGSLLLICIHISKRRRKIELTEQVRALEVITLGIRASVFHIYQQNLLMFM